MTDSPRTLTCPSCGSPLQADENDRRVQCQYCHATVDLPDNDPPVVIVPGSIPSKQPSRRATSMRIGQILATIILVGITVVILFLSVVMPARNKEVTSTTPRLLSIFGPQLVSTSGGQTDDILGIGRTGQDPYQYPIASLDFDGEDPITWLAEDLGEDAYQAKVLPGGEAVYFADKTRLAALRRSDGLKLWETSLSDQLSPGCGACLQERDGILYAFTQLGMLHAFDEQSGKQLWSARNSNAASELYVFNSGPALIENTEGQVSILLFDGRTGTVLHRLVPDCPNRTFPGQVQGLSVSAMLWPSSDGDTFTTAYGFWDPACLDQWDTRSGTRLWQAEFPEGFTRGDLKITTDNTSHYLTPQNSGELWAVDAASSTPRMVHTNPDYIFQPLYDYENVLAVQAERTIGSTRYELWGLDKATGEKLWQYIPQAARPLSESPSSIMDADGIFTTSGRGDELVLLQAFDDPGRITVERIDMASGTSRDPVSISTPESSIFSFDLIGWQDDLAWVEMDGIHTIDTNTGELVTRWE